MIKFIYPYDTYDFAKYNEKEHTWTVSDENDCWSLEWLLTFVGIEYENIFKIPADKCYVKFNLNLPTTYSDLNNLPEKIWTLIENNDNVFLLLYQATEAVPFYFYYPRWNNLKTFLKERGIPPEKIKFLCGDIDATINHKSNRDEYWSYIDVIGLNIFELVHFWRHFAHNDKTIHENCLTEYVKNTHKIKKFLNFNNRSRPNKQALLYYLKKFNLIDYGYVSNLSAEQDESLMSKYEFNNFYNYDKSNYSDFVENIPGQLSLDNFGCADASSPALYYNTSYFSLVSETFTGNKVRFITEKTYKPILMGHPFTIHGTTNTLEYLKEIGYLTFPEIFDESYDDSVDTKEQLKKNLNNLSVKVKINKSLQKKLYHNQKHFLSIPSRSIVKDKLRKFL